MTTHTTTETVIVTVHRCPRCGRDWEELPGQGPPREPDHVDHHGRPCVGPVRRDVATGVPLPPDDIHRTTATVDRCLRCGATTETPASEAWRGAHLPPPAVTAAGLAAVCMEPRR